VHKCGECDLVPVQVVDEVLDDAELIGERPIAPEVNVVPAEIMGGLIRTSTLTPLLSSPTLTKMMKSIPKQT
jgi:hypothetical protein